MTITHCHLFIHLVVVSTFFSTEKLQIVQKISIFQSTLSWICIFISAIHREKESFDILNSEDYDQCAHKPIIKPLRYQQLT